MFPPEIGLPESAESVQALHSLENMDRVGIVYSMRLIVDLPSDSVSETDTGWSAVDRITKRIAADPRCARVISITTLAAGNRAALTDLLRETRRTFLSSDGHAALLEVLPATSVSLRDQVDWVRELRKTGAPALPGIPGATLEIGGIPALNADYQTIVEQHLPAVTALVVGATLLALLAGFRSLFAAVKAIVLNLVSVAAAFGALRPGLSGWTRQQAAGSPRWNRQHLSAGSYRCLCHRLRIQHGLRSVPGRAGSRSQKGLVSAKRTRSPRAWPEPQA